MEYAKVCYRAGSLEENADHLEAAVTSFGEALVAYRDLAGAEPTGELAKRILKCEHALTRLEGAPPPSRSGSKP